MCNLGVSEIVSQSSCSGLSIAWLGFMIVLGFSTCSRVNALLFFLWAAIVLPHSFLCHFFSLAPCAFSSYAFRGFNDLWARCTLKLPQLLFLGCFFISAFFSQLMKLCSPARFPWLSATQALVDATRPLLFIPQLLLKPEGWIFSTGQCDVYVAVLANCCGCLCSSHSWSNRRCLVALMHMDWGFNCWVIHPLCRTLAPHWTLWITQQK